MVVVEEETENKAGSTVRQRLASRSLPRESNLAPIHGGGSARLGYLLLGCFDVDHICLLMAEHGS